jgi:hypothetical protein
MLHQNALEEARLIDERLVARKQFFAPICRTKKQKVFGVLVHIAMRVGCNADDGVELGASKLRRDASDLKHMPSSFAVVNII